MPKTAPNFDVATRTAVITLRAPAGAGLSSAQVEAITGIKVRQVNRLYAQAQERGFDPN